MNAVHYCWVARKHCHCPEGDRCDDDDDYNTEEESDKDIYQRRYDDETES